MNPYRHENKVIINRIFDLFYEGYSIPEIAEMLGTTAAQIQYIFILEDLSHNSVSTDSNFVLYFK